MSYHDRDGFTSKGKHNSKNGFFTSYIKTDILLKQAKVNKDRKH